MGRTPDAVRGLVCVAATGDVGAAKALLRANPGAARDWRPIMEASYKGFPDIVKVLVRHGADVNAVSTAEHNRPLHRAIEQGHADVVNVLLSSGADIEAPEGVCGELSFDRIELFLQSSPAEKCLDGEYSINLLNS